MVELPVRVPSHAEGLQRMFLKNFAAFTTEPITYEGETEQPRPAVVKLSVFRKFTCVEFCGACCQNVELEYLPHEQKTKQAKLTNVEINGSSFPIYLDKQYENSTPWCRHLSVGVKSDPAPRPGLRNGRCTIHRLFPDSMRQEQDIGVRHPLSCDLPPLRIANAWAGDPDNKLHIWKVESREFSDRVQRNWVNCIEPESGTRKAGEPARARCEFEPKSVSTFDPSLVDSEAVSDMLRRFLH